ncbi:Cysteine--tRNA ligase [bioreactor metagenome]|uniref:Cysteine--tRNA ligase n=1 Tax=bioreactor metagenome TaxID=1076179 RepID=A0A645DDM4_9ZZZZ
MLELYLDWADLLGFASAFQENDGLEESLKRVVEELIAKRQEARQTKNWVTADAIRKELEDMGVIIKDTPQGVQWQRK